MENDEDLFVLIIGDEQSDAPEQSEIKLKVGSINREEKTVRIKHVFKKKEDTGEILNLDDSDSNIQSCYEEDEVNDELNDIKSEYNEKYDLTYDVDEELQENNEISSDEEKQTIRRRKLTGYERRSYVSELKERYPELKEDNELLVNCLAEVMKALKPPPLPLDYFVMNGIMFQCVKCDVKTDSIPAAGRHYHERHGARYLKCYACGADFRSKTNLYKHERVCSAPDIAVALKARALFLGRRRSSKPITSKEPKPKRVLKKHTADSYKCTLCSSVFLTKCGLQAHKYFHSGERPFRCPHCPNAYTSRSTLARHVSTLHSNYYYICDICQRRFRDKSAIAMHMNTHEPMRKYACSECDNRYAAKTTLQMHVNRDHRGLPLPFPCTRCPKRYPWKCSLAEHMKKVHGMVLFTRQGFFKKLPTLSSTQLQHAEVILKKDLDNVNS